MTLDRPFELLKLIRDGQIKNDKDLKLIAGFVGISRFYFFLKRTIDRFSYLGLVKQNDDGKIEPTPQLGMFLESLDLSLTQLSAYSRYSIVCSPIFGLPSEPTTQTDIFVLMPFCKALQPIYDDHIKKIAIKLGLKISRADDFFTADSVIANIWDAINAAKVVIADCTNRNPNVFYEIGIAHTLGKPVILIAQNNDDIPFDLRHIRSIVYEFTPCGMSDFEDSLEKTVSVELSKTRTIYDVLNFINKKK